MTVFLNGVIYTLDPAQPRVEAVACERGRIVATGRSDELRAVATAPREVVDLGGRAVVPGLIDAHIHFLGLGLALGQVDLNGAATLAECVQRVADRARETPAGGPLIGRGWNQNDWTEGRWPRRGDLDAVTGERPVALSSKDGHLLWVNTAALRLAGITRETPDPAGGEIVRNEHGEPAGVLKENATRAVDAALPPPTDEEIDAALQRAAEHALALGLTGIGNFEGREALRAFGRCAAAGAAYPRRRAYRRTLLSTRRWRPGCTAASATSGYALGRSSCSPMGRSARRQRR